MAFVRYFFMQFVEQQKNVEHWSLKEAIVRVVGTWLELLLHEEACY
jgi:hypothetical protein